MGNIKWVGIIRGDLNQYQMGELQDGAKKIEGPETMSEMMVRAVPCLFLSLAVLLGSMFVKTYLSKTVVIKPLFVGIGFAAGFLLLLAHEWLHAVVYPSEATVYIGLYPKAFAALALASYPLSRRRFALMCLLPYILGIVPIAAFWFMPAHCVEINGLLFGLALMGLVSPYPDLYNVILVAGQTKKNDLIQFYGDNIYYFSV